MVFTDAIKAIDNEIARLEKVKALLSGEEAHTTRPATKKKAAEQATPGKRTMSAEGRARIAAAQKKRWAKQKKAAK